MKPAIITEKEHAKYSMKYPLNTCRRIRLLRRTPCCTGTAQSLHRQTKQEKRRYERFRYTCSIIDLFDRSAIASMNSDYINTELAKDTLKAALQQEKYPKNLIIHSDQGQQFASWEFVMFCKEQGITQSMSKAWYWIGYN